MKKAIKANNLMTIRCDAREMQLFLAKTDGSWLAFTEDLGELIQIEGFTDQMEKMCLVRKLSDPRLFGPRVFWERM